MQPEIERCLEAVRHQLPETASALSPEALERLIERIYAEDPKLSEAVAAKSGEFNPRAPIYLFVHEIVTFCCTVYAVFEIVGKIDNITTVMVDPNVQTKIIERTIYKLRKVGLTYPAEKLERILNDVLDYLTRPPAT